MNKLYFGDNLDILREHIKDETVDLVYLDPPFNSKRDYNLLFKTPVGHTADARSVREGTQLERRCGYIDARKEKRLYEPYGLTEEEIGIVEGRG